MVNLGKISVLLSTYNGERFLNQQLESLYDQTFSNTRILVRDDGSSDTTVELIEKERLQGRLEVLPGDKNIGPAASFLELLSRSEADSGFFAFCDQDDVWYPNKLDRAIKILGAIDSDTPALYFSRLKYVDDENNFIKLSPLPKVIDFGNALVENIATGCTVVLNRAARNLIVKSIPDKCLMHDSWCYLVVSCFGKVVFDEQPSIRYRQHSNNAIGAATSLLDNLIRRIKRFNLRKEGVFRFSDQAQQFLELYGPIVPEQKKPLLLKVVQAKTSLSARLCLIFDPNIKRQTVFDNLVLRLFILLNRF